MNPKSTRPPVNTRAQIRRAEVFGAVAVGFAGAICGMCFGKPFSLACSAGAACTLGCLASWFTYHIVGRRNDGLALMAGNLFPVISREPISFWGALVIVLVVNVPLAWILGRTARGWRQEKPDPNATGPLYDAQLDHPA